MLAGGRRRRSTVAASSSSSTRIRDARARRPARAARRARTGAVALVHVAAARALEPLLVRLQTAGVSVAVVRPGDDLRTALGAPWLGAPSPRAAGARARLELAAARAVAARARRGRRSSSRSRCCLRSRPAAASMLAAVAAALLAVPLVALDERLDGRCAGAGDRFARGFRAFYEVTLPFGTAPSGDARRPARRALRLRARARTHRGGAPRRRCARRAARRRRLAGDAARRRRDRAAARRSSPRRSGCSRRSATARSPTRPLAAGALVLGRGGVASTSSSVARGGLLDWQSWQPAGKAQDAVSVGYVWRASYDGLDWPEARDDGAAHPRPRAVALLEGDDARRVRRRALVRGARAGLPTRSADRLLPSRGRDESNWLFTQVEVVGLHDTPPARAGNSGARRAARTSRTSRAARAPAASTAATPTASRATSRHPRRGSSHARARPIPAAADRYLAVERGGAYEPLYRRALAVAGKAGSPYGAALSLESWFRTRGGFRYDEHPPAAREPALVDFVVRTRAGYCQHFAGAMTLMLRMLGVPARVAVGFTSGSYDAGTREWTVTDHDAHAWVEAWFPGWGWLPFDPTPGRGDLDGSYTSASPSFDAGAAAAVGRSSALGASLAQRARAHPELIGGQPELRRRRDRALRRSRHAPARAARPAGPRRRGRGSRQRSTSRGGSPTGAHPTRAPGRGPRGRAHRLRGRPRSRAAGRRDAGRAGAARRAVALRRRRGPVCPRRDRGRVREPARGEAAVADAARELASCSARSGARCLPLAGSAARSR